MHMPGIVGFLDADDALHNATVAKFKEIVGSRPLAVSVISYAEVMTGVSLGPHPKEGVDGLFDAFVKDLLPVDRPVATRYAPFRFGRGRRFLDRPCRALRRPFGDPTARAGWAGEGEVRRYGVA